MKRYARISEYVWLSLSILCVILTAFFFISKENDNAVFAMCMTALAVVMYNMRRIFNRRIARQEKEELEKTGK